MSWRTVVISSRAKLDYKMGYMVIRGSTTKRIFMDEIAILMLENPAVSFTGVLVNALIEKKVKVIFCDSSRNPSAELCPYHGSHDSSRKIRSQAVWGDEIKKEVWREIIYDKIFRQAAFLSELGYEREELLLRSYLESLLPGDESNREGHAAKVYFNALFGMKFVRGSDSPINSALDYGYGIILSAVNREIALNGYITQLGVFHNNVFNHFNLGSDLMEPFRVTVDRCVFEMQPEEFGSEEKRVIISIINNSVRINGSEQTLLNAIKIYVRSVFDAITSNDPHKIIFMERP